MTLFNNQCVSLRISVCSRNKSDHCVRSGCEGVSCEMWIIDASRLNYCLYWTSTLPIIELEAGLKVILTLSQAELEMHKAAEQAVSPQKKLHSCPSTVVANKTCNCHGTPTTHNTPLPQHTPWASAPPASHPHRTRHCHCR
jgi:hypothetical protein